MLSTNDRVNKQRFQHTVISTNYYWIHIRKKNTCFNFVKLSEGRGSTRIPQRPRKANRSSHPISRHPIIALERHLFMDQCCHNRSFYTQILMIKLVLQFRKTSSRCSDKIWDTAVSQLINIAWHYLMLHHPPSRSCVAKPTIAYTLRLIRDIVTSQVRVLWGCFFSGSLQPFVQ